ILRTLASKDASTPRRRFPHQGTDDAPRWRARGDDDQEEDDEVKRIEEVQLLRGHAAALPPNGRRLAGRCNIAASRVGHSQAASARTTDRTSLTRPDE